MYSMAEDKGAVRGTKVGRPRKYETKSDKQRAYITQKLQTKVQTKVLLSPDDRDTLNKLCKLRGVTQGELVTELIKKYAIEVLD